MKKKDRATVIGGAKSVPGHAPQQDFAMLSDGSKVKLTGPNKGLIFRWKEKSKVVYSLTTCSLDHN